MDEKKFNVDCPACDGLGVIISGFDKDAYENIESDCPTCSGSGMMEVVPVSAVDACMNLNEQIGRKLVDMLTGTDFPVEITIAHFSVEKKAIVVRASNAIGGYSVMYNEWLELSALLGRAMDESKTTTD